MCILLLILLLFYYCIIIIIIIIFKLPSVVKILRVKSYKDYYYVNNVIIIILIIIIIRPYNYYITLRDVVLGTRSRTHTRHVVEAISCYRFCSYLLKMQRREPRVTCITSTRDNCVLTEL